MDKAYLETSGRKNIQGFIKPSEKETKKKRMIKRIFAHRSKLAGHKAFSILQRRYWVVFFVIIRHNSIIFGKWKHNSKLNMRPD